MTNSVMQEIYGLAEEALSHGQERIPVHVFPFRMTETNLAAHNVPRWRDFWLNLKEAHDAFERTRVPPKVTVCGKRYVLSEELVADDCEVLEAVTIAEERPRVVVAAKKRGRKVASKSNPRVVPGRNARKAYAAARRARIAAHARRVRTTAALGSGRGQCADCESQSQSDHFRLPETSKN
jgi:murein L,D-transpeptidase YafK